MLTLTIGTFAIALNHILLIGALILATLVGWRVAKRGGENPESVLFSLFLLGMLAARVSFVLMYWSYYSNDWVEMVDLRDGGFLAWPGIIALVLGALAYGWRRPALRKPLCAGVITGLVFWGMASLSLSVYEKGTRLPDITLRNATGGLPGRAAGDQPVGYMVPAVPSRNAGAGKRPAPAPRRDLPVRQPGRKHAKRQHLPGHPGPESR